MEAAARELAGILRSPNAVVRQKAAEAAEGLTGSSDGRALLAAGGVIDALRNLLGDSVAAVAEPALRGLINLAADEATREAVAREGVVSSAMEGLREPESGLKRGLVLLLANLTASERGAALILQVPPPGEAGSGEGATSSATTSARRGLHFRRLIQWFVAPVRPPPAGAPPRAKFLCEGIAADEFE
jgi:hypothetical protein